MQSRQARPSLIRTASSLPDIVLVIATALNKEGICAVLTGDAAAAMHTSGGSVARLNYSLTPPVAASRLASAMRHLGFDGPTDGAYRHPDLPLRLELTQETLTIGRSKTIVPQTLQLRHGFVRILSPTDCCREQLLRWHAGRDAAGMDSAVTLAKRCDIKMADIRAWMRTEGCQALWAEFRKLVEETDTRFGEKPAVNRASRSR